MSRRSDEVYLADMVAACHRLQRHVAGRSRTDLDTDELLEDAVCRQLEILGEAASKVSDARARTLSAIPWRAIVGMRNQLIHAYHRVDLDLVWHRPASMV